MFQVVEFTFDNFHKACEHDLRPLESLEGKRKLEYLFDYLDHLGCQSILVEPTYVDRDYLDDYSAYYVKCFPEYERFCTRLHYFDKDFSNDEFDSFLTREGNLTNEELQDTYLGFSVLKPLPDAFLGRTCVTTYPADGGRRQFPMTRRYAAHLAGCELEIESLAFQEQDTVIAACATSAIWSALHKAAKLFGTATPTPAEITAIGAERARGRGLPSVGLTIGGMCHAIKGVDLEVELREGPKIQTDIRELVYGYGEMGIPSILVIDLVDQNDQKVHLDSHALTVGGYSLGNNDPQEPLAAYSIDKLYVHDDQHGPFSRSEVKNPRKIGTKFEDNGNSLDGSVIAIIIPIYHKIRIKYEEARVEVARLSALLKALDIDLHWDLKLTTVPRFHASIADDSSVDPDTRRMVYTKPWPRFIWRARGFYDGAPAMELLMDATDIQRSFFVDELIFMEPSIPSMLSNILSEDRVTDLMRSRLGFSRQWIQLLRESARKDE